VTPDPERSRYARLPEPVRLEDTIAEVDVRPVPDPEGGTDPETAFVIRNAG
jgi:hypothetical protein